jgi:hypothetical protein
MPLFPLETPPYGTVKGSDGSCHVNFSGKLSYLKAISPFVKASHIAFTFSSAVSVDFMNQIL